ncbi:hypothetical protein GCM10027516_21660 [Niabella aquatica]
MGVPPALPTLQGQHTAGVGLLWGTLRFRALHQLPSVTARRIPHAGEEKNNYPEVTFCTSGLNESTYTG